MKVYLDNNSATMTDEQVIQAMQEFLDENYADVTAPHKQAQKMREALKGSFEKIRASIHARESDEFCFASSDDEMNYRLFMSIYLDKVITGQKNHIIISERAGKTIQDATMFFASQGCKVTVLPVDKNGLVEPQSLKESINSKTALVSISMTDRENGAIMPALELSSICKEHDIPFHCDATYAMGKESIDVQMLDLDYLTLGAHAIHGPSGTALMYVKSGGMLGGLQFPIKNAANIIGIAKALELSSDAMAFEMEDVRELRDELEECIREIDESLIVVPWANRTANVLVAGFKNIQAELLAWHLNKKNIYVHMLESVELVESLEIDIAYSHTLIGFSLSRYTTNDEIEYVKKMLVVTVGEIRDSLAPKVQKGTE